MIYAPQHAVIRNCRALPPLNVPARSNAKLKTFNQTTVTVDRNVAPIAATAHTANRCSAFIETGIIDNQICIT